MPLSHEHVGSKILAKIKIYILARAELLCPLCYDYQIITDCKGQLVSKSLFDVFNSPKKRTKTIRLEVP